MSNVLNIDVVEFVSHLSSGKTETTYGLKIYDDYAKDYYNLCESLQEAMDMVATPGDAQATVEEYFPDFSDFDGYTSVCLQGETFPIEDFLGDSDEDEDEDTSDEEDEP